MIVLNKHIINEETNINEEVLKKHFNFQKSSDMLIYLNERNDKEKNNELVKIFNSGLEDLKEEIKKMSKEEIEIQNC